MSGQKYFFLVLLLAGLLWVSCEDKQAIPPVRYLDNTIYATLAMWPVTVSNNANAFTPVKVTFSKDNLSIYATDNLSYGTFALGIYYIRAKTPGIYLISNQGYAYFNEWGFSSPQSFSWSTDSTHTGSINITLLDTINHKVSATFEFTALCHTIKNPGTVSKGHFTNVSW